MLMSYLSSLTTIDGLLPKFLRSLEIDRKSGPVEANSSKSCLQKLSSANNYEEWYKLATEYDNRMEIVEWKADPQSKFYNYKLIQNRLGQFQFARSSKDISLLFFLMRTALSRDFAGINHPSLFSTSQLGTKDLITNYREEICQCIRYIVSEKEMEKKYGAEIAVDRKLDCILKTRQIFGSTAILLSGGATYGLIHTGVIISLHKQKLLPKIICGSSAGAIVASVVCVKTDSELDDYENFLKNAQFNAFRSKENPDSIWIVLERLFKHGYLFEKENLSTIMRNIIGDMTFLESYNKTRRILNITVSSGGIYEMPQLLNYITAPDVLIWSAVVASSAVPCIFEKAKLYAKRAHIEEIVEWNASSNRFVDGSLENDLPMKKLTELFHVNHFIVCQVNPHIAPFVKFECNTAQSKAMKMIKVVLQDLLFPETLHIVHLLSEAGIAKFPFSKLHSVLSQKYNGDITIFPKLNFVNLCKVFANPSDKMVNEYQLDGHRATWPKLGFIRSQCAIELELNKAVQDLRKQKVALKLIKTQNKFSRHISKSVPLKHSNFEKSSEKQLVSMPKVCMSVDAKRMHESANTSK